jgi:positive regulator of sigma E activity
MREEGVVRAVTASGARVALNAAGCAQCGSCGVCREQGRVVELDADAPEGVRPGDRVIVEVPGPGPLRGAVVLLLVPLLAFFAGIVLGEWLRARGSVSFDSWFSFLLGLLCMAAAYFGAGLYDRRIRRAPATRARIVEALDREGEGGEAIQDE